MKLPDKVSAIVNDQLLNLAPDGDMKWATSGVGVRLENTADGLAIFVNAPASSLSAVMLKWNTAVSASSTILNDHWERTYGDVSWHAPRNTEILPWYFMEHTPAGTNGFGVKTGTRSFCFWKIDPDAVTLTLDTRCGGEGVLLGSRELMAAEVVTMTGQPEKTPFQTTREFAGKMCSKVRMPKAPVYGINDWYYTYGNNSAELILNHTHLMSPFADGLSNRPFSVIDAGWFEPAKELPEDRSWGSVNISNKLFGDMHALGEKIRAAGMRPGLWTRPLCGSKDESVSRMLPVNKDRGKNEPVLDPTIPENMEKIKSYFKLYSQWGYDLIKFDYTSFDIFGKWGFKMISDGTIASPGWSFHDRSQTSAEIILNLYREIRSAAGDTYLLGCNTFSHLSAGLFELNRIGDDTSGNDWERTRKMGVNTLAFRSTHHGIFYSADADCVGLTTKIPWEKNRQWMELLARSGTPLFISAQPEAVGAEQKPNIRTSFEYASQPTVVCEPLDWLRNAVPQQWILGGSPMIFRW